MPYNLLDLHVKGLPRLLDGIDTREAWESKRSGIREVWLEMIGGLPERVPVDYEVLDEERHSGHRRIHLAYRTVDDDRVTAFLLVPDEQAAGRGANGLRPAVIALHPTNEFGKATVATPEGRENRQYGLELVARGYVVLAPDALTAGERIYDGHKNFCNAPFYERYPEWSSVGKNAVDHRQGVDLLCSLEGVDARRIGAIGHSFGGYNAFFLAGLDDRIRAVVNSCGFSSFYGDRRPTQWGIRGSWYTHLPKITEWLSRYEVPFEFHEIAALAAPVPFFNYYAQNDGILRHWKEIGECMDDLYKLYRFLDAEPKFQSLMGVREHDFPPDIRRLAYEFLDRWLVER